MTAEDVLTTQGFDTAYTALLSSERHIWPARSWAPSQVGHPCDRFLVWRWNRHQQQALHDPTLQAIFDEGNVHQPHVYQRLEKLGFEIVREQDRPRQWEPRPGVVISGRIDGRLIGYQRERYATPRILEIKTTQGYQFDRLNTIDDIRRSDKHYIRGYFEQGILYCLLENLPQGVIVLKNKQTGMLKLIPFELDYAAAEEIVARLERLSPLVKDKADPPPIPYAVDTCGRCGFNALCYPPRPSGEGVHLFDDAQLLEDLEERAGLAEAAFRYKDLDETVKARVKGQLGEGAALCGPWAIEVKKVEKSIKATSAHTRVETHVKLSRVE